jgi:hypothetical protein
MKLLERYLQAVRWALPRAKADDMVAELRDDLATRIEDREEALGRPLTDEEESALIKEFGHPLMVAARYRPQQWLIGPDVFPFYKFVLQIVLLAVVGIQLAVAGARILFADNPVSHVVGPAIGGIWLSILISGGIVTLTFAVLERVGFPAKHLQSWKPEQLPPLHQHRKSVGESVFEVTASVLFLLWWVGLIHLPWTAGYGFRLEMAPIFAQLFWPILLLAAARLVLNLIDWFRPGWAAVRGTIEVATTLAALVLLVIIYHAGHWAVVTPLGMPADKAAAIEASVNLSLKISLVVAAVVWVWQCLLVLWRLVRGRTSPAATAI